MRPCDNCGESRPTYGGGLIMNGWLIDWHEFGYYAGFHDNFPRDGASKPINICHECCLKVIEALPVLRRFMARGHSVSGDGAPSCCEFAWTMGTDARGYEVVCDSDGQGGWEIPRF